MAILNNTHITADIEARASNVRTDLRQRFEAWKVYRRTLNELNQLNDRELNDLGLHRSSIRRIAIEAAYGA